MSRHLFGWSYPPGCSGPPEDPEPYSLRCKHCKSFIGGTPIRLESWESASPCDGKVDSFGNSQCGCDMKEHAPHKEVWDCGTFQIFVCKRCKKETKIG